MKTFIRYILSAIIFYFMVNWVADNPDSFDTFRNKMNEIVDACVTKVKEVTQGHP